MAADGSVTGTAMGGGGELRPHGWRAPLSMVNGLGHVTEPCMEPSWEPWAGGSSSPIRNIWVVVGLDSCPLSAFLGWSLDEESSGWLSTRQKHIHIPPLLSFWSFFVMRCGMWSTRRHARTSIHMHLIPQAEKRQRIRSTCRPDA